MNVHSTLYTKEVIALDADDHLVRPTLIYLSVSEVRLPQMRVDLVPACCILYSAG